MQALKLSYILQEIIHKPYPIISIVNFYKTGDFLFKTGAPVFGVMFIYSGAIEIIYKNEDNFLINNFLGPGEILPKDLHLPYYPFAARAAKDSLIFFFDKYFLEKHFNICMEEKS